MKADEARSQAWPARSPVRGILHFGHDRPVTDLTALTALMGLGGQPLGAGRTKADRGQRLRRSDGLELGVCAEPCDQVVELRDVPGDARGVAL